jgi:hypothetical protein
MSGFKLMEGLVDNLVGGVSMVQYVDGSVIMFQDSIHSARDLKAILCIFLAAFRVIKLTFINVVFLFGFGRAKKKFKNTLLFSIVH